MNADTLKMRVRELGEPIADSLGLYLYDLDVVRAGRLVIRVAAERRSKTSPKDGITISECASLSRQLEHALDLEEMIPEQYVLEVSSPGVERRLRSAEHFAGAVGESVRIVARSQQSDETVVEGVLVAAGETDVVVEHDDTRVPLALSEIRRATTVYRG